jgi:protein phosphatase
MEKLLHSVSTRESAILHSSDGDRRAPLMLEAAGVSHPGRRRLNQDQFLIADLAAARRREGVGIGNDRGSESLMVVADGMGGHPGGEVASLLAVRVLLRELVHEANGDNPVRRLERALRSSDEEIHSAGARRGDLASMGTTLTAAWWIPPMLYFAHVGHSRLYLLRGGRLARLTKDHTVSAGMTEAGFEETKAAGFEHVLTQALGGDHEGVDAEAGCRRLQLGDVLLLCTDGLLRGVDEDHITRVLEEVHSAPDAAAGLLESALATDDLDNITALVARVEAEPGEGFTGSRSSA